MGFLRTVDYRRTNGATSLGSLRFSSSFSSVAREASQRLRLLAHFEEGLHPSAYPPDRAALKPSLDYYYAASVSRAFVMLPVSNDDPLGRGEWASRLSRRLISRQTGDGSWHNPAVDVREDDPIIATSFALLALRHCREGLRPAGAVDR